VFCHGKYFYVIGLSMFLCFAECGEWSLPSFLSNWVFRVLDKLPLESQRISSQHGVLLIGWFAIYLQMPDPEYAMQSPSQLFVLCVFSPRGFSRNKTFDESILFMIWGVEWMAFLVSFLCS
jgi:hypothetical protein